MAGHAKLQYMDSLMKGLAGAPPVVTTTEQVDPLRHAQANTA